MDFPPFLNYRFSVPFFCVFCFCHETNEMRPLKWKIFFIGDCLRNGAAFSQLKILVKRKKIRDFLHPLQVITNLYFMLQILVKLLSNETRAKKKRKRFTWTINKTPFRFSFRFSFVSIHHLFYFYLIWKILFLNRPQTQLDCVSMTVGKERKGENLNVAIKNCFSLALEFKVMIRLNILPWNSRFERKKKNFLKSHQSKF